MQDFNDPLFDDGSADDSVDQTIRPIDQAVLNLLRRHGSLTIQDLIEQLSVTATAVRQRLDRLEQLRLIVKEKQGVGRGRPSFRYSITNLGLRFAGVSYADLALALWHEVNLLPSSTIKDALLQRVSNRMGRAYRDEIQGDTVEDRLTDLVKVLGDRKIPATLISNGQLPVLEVQACPYPELVNGDPANRHLCEMEQEVLSAAMGQPMELSVCRLDGHNCCQFRPVSGTTTVTTIPLSPS
jgi:predicted ArsR family transcriptional regulator